MLKKIFYLIFPLFSSVGCFYAQTVEAITIEECYQFARENYPAIKKLNLVAKTSEFDLQNANKRFLPQVSFSGQASYQSEVVGFGDAFGSLPMAANIPTLSKDQYKIVGEINQLIYDGGNVKNQKEIIKSYAALQEQNIETNLYLIKQRINNLYFSVLLMDAQLQQNETKRKNIQTQIQKAEASLKYGTAFRSSVDELKAELVNVNMATTEYQYNRTAYLKMLGLFVGKELSENTDLQTPELDSIFNEIKRPELKTFELQKSLYDIQRKQLKSEYLPTVSAFFQGAYGRPTLNIINNNFGPWYITGLRFNWNLSSLYSLSNKKNNLLLSQELIDADKETFLLNTKIDLSQQDEQVQKYTELLVQDNDAIVFRTSVTKSAEAQLSNGVITTHEYIQKLNAEDLAKQTKILHEIQLLQAKYNQKFISGN